MGQRDSTHKHLGFGEGEALATAATPKINGLDAGHLVAGPQPEPQVGALLAQRQWLVGLVHVLQMVVVENNARIDQKSNKNLNFASILILRRKATETRARYGKIPTICKKMYFQHQVPPHSKNLKKIHQPKTEWK